MTPVDVHLSKEEMTRYDRHIIIPDFGLQAQRKLKASRVLVVGAGGLGSPLLMYLAAAGVGTIGIVDGDVVEDSNLQRQVLFGIEDIGLPKVEVAKQRLLQINPFINICIHHCNLTASNALELIGGYDVIADGTDNFPARYLINDACVFLNKPNVFASIFQFEGQVTVFNAVNKKGERGPNYRDLFASPPPPGVVPNCAEGGVLGVLPGIIGSMQALEIIKVITGVGDVLQGRLFVFDALTFEPRILTFKKRLSNPLTGDNRTIHSLMDYEQFCGMPASEPKLKEITVGEYLHWKQHKEEMQLIDVREPAEHMASTIGGQLIPLNSVLSQEAQISRDKKVVLYCKSGKRSATAIRQLEAAFGLTNLYNLQGGIDAYRYEVDVIHSGEAVPAR